MPKKTTLSTIDAIHFRSARNALQNAERIFELLGGYLSSHEQSILIDGLTELRIAKRDLLEVVNNGNQESTPPRSKG